MAAEDRYERRRIAASYASALFELAQAGDAVDRIAEQLAGLRSVLEAHPELVTLFESPVVGFEDRRRLIERIGSGCDEMLAGTLAVMNRRGRLGMLPEMIAAFRDQLDRLRGRVRTRLTTATDVDETTLADIRKALGTYLKREPVITHRVDPAIMGGFVARAGDTLIDASVRTQLAMMKERLTQRGEDEVQSGRDHVGH